MSYVIVGIHGLANKPPSKVLDGWWHDAILEGLFRNCGKKGKKIEFNSVFWADLLYKPLQSRSKMKEPYVKAKGRGPLKTYKDGWRDDVVADVLGTWGWTIDAAKRYLGVSAVADKVLAAKLKDLHIYYTNKALRKKLRDRLENRITKDISGKRIMLIAHSMGSIIAYDVLRAIGRKNPSFQLDHFITIGCPLGLPHVKNKIYQENNLVRTPSVVRRWTNFADRRDAVALDVHLADDYAPNDHGVQVKDDLIINGYLSTKGNANYHKSYGYLRAPEVSNAIRAFI